MKRLVLVLALLVLATGSLFALRIKLSSEEKSLHILQSSPQETILHYVIGQFDTEETIINGEEWFQPSLPGEGVTQEKGLPELPVFNRSIIIDNSAHMKLEIFDVEYTDMRMPIAPSKGVISRDVDPKTVPYSFAEFYAGKDFYPNKIAALSDPYIMRDFRGITIRTTPFAYRPDTKTLRIYHSYKIRVYQEGTDTRNVLQQTRSTISRSFSEIYQNHFVNWNNYRYTPLDDSFGKLLIVCHSSFMSTIQPWVNWKRQKGIETELVEWSTIGTTATQLQSYIQNRYNQDGNLSYVQIIGDAPQIPSLSSGGGGSDPSFSLVAGSDNYPDIFIGRFSAENEAQLSVQLFRSIAYERDLNSSATWLSRAMGIASAEGGGSQGDNGESDIQHMNNIRTKLLNYGYSSVDQVYDPGASAATVSANVNAGRGYISYVGHGSDTTWSTTGFSVTDAMNLSNGNMTPFIVDVACVNGNFVSMTCFAEGWMRSPNGGAITIYASTINQSWNSPMRAQDEIADLWVADARTTTGAYYYSGSCKMMDIYGNTTGSDGVNMFKTWHIFGDASLMVRSKTPVAMNPNHPVQMLVGTSVLNITNTAPNALVSLTYNNHIYARAYANSSGTLDLSLVDLPSQPLDFTITVSAYNYDTYVSTVQQIPNGGPFINVETNQYADSNNQVPEYGDSATFDISFRNLGTATAFNLNASLSTSTPGITITDANEALGNLAAGASITLNNAFGISIAESIADATLAEFNILMQSGTESWNHPFTLEINAPNLCYGDFSISDPTGNNNAKLDPGETANLIIPILNNGAAISPGGFTVISSPTPGVSIASPTQFFSPISAGSSECLTFSICADVSIPAGTLAFFSLSSSAGAYTAEHSIQLEVGEPEIISIGSGSSSQSYPLDRYYNYSVHEAIYLADEINALGSISAIAYNKSSGTDTNPIENVNIYMKHSAANTLSNGTYSTSGYTLVFSGSFTNSAGSGWMEVELDTSFEYNGSSNLSILIVKNHQSWISAYPLWKYSSSNTIRARQNRSDSSIPSYLYASANLPDLRLKLFPTIQDAPLIAVSPESISESINSGFTASRTIIISNNGSEDLLWSIPEPEKMERSIAGSTIVSDTASYSPGSNASWNFSVINNSTDNEWLKDIQISFPSTVTVNSVSSLAGGSNELTANLQSGTGITINWHYENSSGYGGIYDGETATATVNVTISSAALGDINLPWIISGDEWGITPHSLQGTIQLTQSNSSQPANWCSLDINSGTTPPGEYSEISLTLNTTDLEDGIYSAAVIINSNAANNPALSIPVSLTVDTPINPFPVEPRFVAEWEPAQGAVVRYPFGQPYSLLADLSEDALLYVIVSDESQSAAHSALQTNGVTMENVQYINAPSDSYWTRDYAPWTIFDAEGDMHLVDFNYNRPRPLDNEIPGVMADFLALDIYDLEMNHTGGNVMTDGRGKAMSTELVISENTELNLTQINQRLSDILGISEYQIYTDPTATYIDHIDCWAKLLDVDKVIIRRVPSTHPQYAAIENSVVQWQAQTSSYGTPYRIFRVDTPNDEPYTNSFIMNGKIYVPQMATANDAAALAVYQSAMPGFEVSGYAFASYQSTDALHCRVNTIFDDQMIFVKHNPPTQLYAHEEFNISVEVEHANPLNLTDSFIKWSSSPSGPWNLRPLIPEDYDTWTSSLTIPAVANLYYYIQAQDNTGRSTKLPLCAELDPFVVDILPNPNLPDWTITQYPNPPATVYATVSVMGNPAEIGDLVGAFVGEECRGTGFVFSNRSNMVSIPIQLAESGENVTFKVYSHTDDLIYDANLELSPGTGEILGADVPLQISCGLVQPVVNISLQDGEIHLNWDHVQNASYYQLGMSESPNGVFTPLFQTVENHCSFPAVFDRCYYIVIAVKDN